jgi:UDP:flavonoid glycosyltransferase YjiC (YdhE family)
MARVLLAWELGTGFGHLVGLRALARELTSRGHECAFAARQLGSAHEFLEPELGPCFQSPVRLGPSHRPVKTQVSYSSLLHNIGFDSPVELAGRIDAWRNLIKALRADYVYADHSPLPLLAAKTLGVKACYTGSGFTVPPLLTPFPSFRPRMNVPAKVLEHNDAEVLKEMNRALARLKLEPLAALQDIFRGAHPALLSYAPLDHYEVKRPEPFLGLPDFSHGAAPKWPDGSGPKIFAYLRPHPGLTSMMDALHKSPARVLVRLSGVAPEGIKRYLRPGLAVVNGAVNFRLAAESCDAFVNYGAHSTVCEFLLAGKPGVLMPDLHERVLTTRRAVQLGACVAVRGKEVQGFLDAIEKALKVDSLVDAAQAFANANRGIDRAKIVPQVVEDTVGRL